MKKKLVAGLATGLFILGLSITHVEASIIQLFDPSEMTGPTSTINFDDAAHLESVNNRYIDFGIEFQRDDGQKVFACNVTDRNTISPPMTLATTSGPDVSTWVSHINLIFSNDTYELGAFIGNDWINLTYTLELYDSTGNSIGSVNYTTNGNKDVDEFLGIYSDIPFRAARFYHQDSRFAVQLDNVSFSAVPIPGAIWLLGTGLAGIAASRRKKK